MTRLRRSACSPRLLAIAGIDTAIIVESSPSMKKAQPTTSGMATRSLGSLIRGMIMKSHDRDDRGRECRRGNRSGADRALGERPSRALSELGGQSAPRAAAPAIDALIARYRELGLIDDVAYAAARTRTRLRRGQSLRTIRAGLAAKGVAEADVAAALATVGEGRDLAAACAFARRRKLGPFRRGAGDRARELAAFARAGFSRRDAEAVLDCADAEAVAALLGG